MDWQKQLASEFGWEKDEAVQRWLTKLKPGAYAKACLQNLQFHCEKTSKTPDELITLRVKQIADSDPRVRAEAEDTVSRIYNELVQNRVGKAINYFRKMKSFYKHNYCALGCSEPEYSPNNHVKDRKTLEKLSKERIRTICEKAQIETRLAILIHAESGGRIGAIMNLTYADIKDDYEAEVMPCCIWLKQATRKKGGTYPSFICGDAVRLLKIVLRGRELNDDTRIFSISRMAIQDFLRDNKLHAHLFRKRTQTVLEDCGVPLNWVDRLLGHQPRGAQGATYSLPPIRKLREQYSKAVKELKIYGSGERVNGELTEALAKVFSHYLEREITAEEISQILKA